MEYALESDLLKNFKKYMDAKNIFYERLNAIYRSDAGKSDFLIVIEGRAHFIELKSRSGKQRIAQKLFEKRVLKSGATYTIIRDIVTLDSFIRMVIENDERDDLN